uniref:Ubiquitin-like domain-containing protein n=1 Tax=Anopheles christyi TaxID=43041 RepID=A0A182KEA1_9DIPT
MSDIFGNLDNFIERNVSLIKRGYTTLCNSYHRKPPVTENDIKKIMKKIDASKCSLKQLEQSIQLLLSPISSNPFPPQTRRTRRSVQDNEAPVLAVISLDCDDDPTSSQPIFQSRYRRMSRRNGANGAGTQTNVISLDSDDENGGAAPLGQSSAANNSFESENYEMRIKVKWGRGIETFVHRRYQKFDDIIGQLAAKESADKGCIFFNLDDRIVYPSDTPDSINYKSHQFISGRILRTKALTLPASVGPSAGNSNMISLKIQMENRKQPLRLQIEKNQTMSVLVIKCAEELKCEPKAIRLYFDGELVDNGNKPEDLDLEGDEILDIRFVK